MNWHALGATRTACLRSSPKRRAAFVGCVGSVLMVAAVDPKLSGVQHRRMNDGTISVLRACGSAYAGRT